MYKVDLTEDQAALIIGLFSNVAITEPVEAMFPLIDELLDQGAHGMSVFTRVNSWGFWEIENAENRKEEDEDD